MALIVFRRILSTHKLFSVPFETEWCVCLRITRGEQRVSYRTNTTPKNDKNYYAQRIGHFFVKLFDFALNFFLSAFCLSWDLSFSLQFTRALHKMVAERRAPSTLPGGRNRQHLILWPTLLHMSLARWCFSSTRLSLYWFDLSTHWQFVSNSEISFLDWNVTPSWIRQRKSINSSLASSIYNRINKLEK